MSNIEKKIKQNEPMKNHTSFKIGGTADLFLKVATIEELMQAIEYAKTKKIPIYFIGNGSNLLVTDKGIRGLVVKIDIQNISIQKAENSVKVTVGAGYKMIALARELLNQEITGFEEFAGIPGTIGGAIYMNAGAYGKEMKDIVISTKCMDLNGKIFILSNKEQEFTYRNSIFEKNNYIILETTLQLKKGIKNEIENKMTKLLKERKEKQPIGEPSAGSTFKRQEGIITAKLIDECGLKGYSIGDAYVSQKHAGFIINKGKATAKDVLMLIDTIKRKVYDKFNVNIELEIEVIGED